MKAKKKVTPKKVKGKGSFRFEKGNKYGKGGYKGLPAELKAARKLNATESFRIVNEYAWMSPIQLEMLKELANDIPMYEMGIITAFAKFAKTGDDSHIKFWLEHLVGKPKERVQHSGEVKTPMDLSKISKDDLKKLIKLGEKK